MATLTPARQMLAAHATVDFTASDASNVVLIELHPNMQITAITNANGKPVTFARDTGNPLQLRINLDSLVSAGGTVTLNFDYAGHLQDATEPARPKSSPQSPRRHRRHRRCHPCC
jgi:hypothetical protein